MGFWNSAPVLALVGALVFVDALALCTVHLDHTGARRAADLHRELIASVAAGAARPNG